MPRAIRNTIAISGLLALLLWVVIPATSVEAGEGLKERLGKTGEAAGYKPDTNETTLSEIVGKIIYGATSLVGIIFVAQMVYAGWLWMTAAGEEEQLTKAKHIIRRSIVGLAIVLAAWAITFSVLSMLYRATAAGG